LASEPKVIIGFALFEADQRVGELRRNGFRAAATTAPEILGLSPF